MKTYTSLFLWATFVLFGRTHSRLASDVSVLARTDNEAACVHEATPNKTVPFILLDKQYECYKPSSGFLRKINTAPNTAAYRTIFRSACAQEASVRSCIANVSVEAAACLNDLELKMYSTVRDFVEATITETCANSGEAVATIYGEEYKPLNFIGKMRVIQCMMTVMTLSRFNETETDLPAYTLRRYRAMQIGRCCIMNIAKSRESNLEDFGRFVGDLISDSKCIAADTQEIVLCQTLVPEPDIQSL